MRQRGPCICLPGLMAALADQRDQPQEIPAALEHPRLARAPSPGRPPAQGMSGLPPREEWPPVAPSWELASL